ncbi:tyrosine-type recombinase/integrase [Chloroflexota bacterium]
MVKQVVDRLLLESLVSTTSLESLIKGYLLTCRTENKSPKTIRGYESTLRNFNWYCNQNKFPEVQQLTAVHIRHFLWYLGSESNRWNGTNPSARHPASNTTINDYFRALRTFFNWLEREELVIDNPFRHLKTPKPDNNIIQALTPAEIERLFKVCSGKSMLDVRNRAILSVFLDTGLRLSELIDLTLDDVNMDDGSILVKKGKGGKPRVVRIGNKAQKALWKYTLYRKGNSNRLFLNRSGEPFKFFGVAIFLKRLGNKAKVKIHAHQLRHTFAISFLRAGGDVFSLQYLLGHSTLSMTQRYLQSLNANDAANAHKKFSPLDNLGK